MNRPAVRTAAVALACLAIVLLDLAGLPLGTPRVIAGTILTLWVPGFSLLLVIRARFLGGASRAVLAVPTSVAVVALTAVVVERLGLGLRPASLIVATTAVSATLLAVAILTDRRRAAEAPGPAEATTAVPITASVAAASATSTGPGHRRRWPGIRGLARELVVHVREPLFLHAYALGLSGLLTSGMGVVYWAVAARAYPVEVVGVNAAVLSLVTLLGNVSQLNLRSGFGRFVPLAGPRTVRLLAWGYGAALLLAAVLSIGFLALLAIAPQLMADVPLTPLFAVLFPLTVISWTAFLIQDHALTALRRTVWVPLENGAFALIKIVLLLVFVNAFAPFGILASWTLPTILAAVAVSGWIFRWGAPAYARDTSRPAVASGGDVLSVRSVTRYVGADYVGSLFAIGSTSLLPVIVLAVLGAATSAHFYIVFLVASAAQLLPSVLTTSLLVEASAEEATFERDGRRVLRQMALLLGPLILVLIAGAPLILGIFGTQYAVEGTNALRLFALAGIPYALIQLAFIRYRLERRVRWILVWQLILAVTLVLGSLVLLPVLGMTAVALVMLVSETIVAGFVTRAELGPLFGRQPRDPDAAAAPTAEPRASRPLDRRPREIARLRDSRGAPRSPHRAPRP